MINFFSNLQGAVADLNNPAYSEKQTAYNNLGIGGIFHIMRDDNVNYGVEDLECYYTENFNWTGIADQIASLGFIDYIIFRAKVETGFCHWPTQVQFPTFQYNGVTVPQRGNDFNLGNSYYSGIGVTDDNIDRFMSEFARVGIKTGIYYPIGRDVNVRTDLPDSELQNSSDPAIYGRYDEYHDYVISHVEELMTLYSPEIFWLDNLTKHPWLNNSGADDRWQKQARVYSAIRDKNPNTIIMGNLNVYSDGGSLYTGNKLQYYPLDVISQEYHREVPDNEYQDLKSHEGRNVLIPMERLYDGLYSDDKEVQYAWWDPASSSAPTNPNQVRDQTTYQNEYDRAKTLGATPCFNFGPLPASVGTGKHLVDSTTMTRLNNLIL
jgi:hypothetical protein